MSLSSSHAIELERRLREDLNSLRALDAKNRDESTELIDRIRNFIKMIRPDLFERSDSNK